MCGRYLLTAPPEALQRLLRFLELPNLQPRYNVAPSQAVAAMLLDAAAERHFTWMRWGLTPSWAKGSGAKGERTRAPMINARSETAAEKASFRGAFAQRRCVVFADGFYEWRQDGNRQPYVVRLTDNAPFAFAALWEPVVAPKESEPATGNWKGGCALLTTEANAKMAAVHHRMPVILTAEEVGAWLDPAAGRDDLQALLKQLPDEAVTLTPISKRVNAVGEDDAGLLEEEEVPVAPSQMKLL